MVKQVYTLPFSGWGTMYIVFISFLITTPNMNPHKAATNHA